MEFLYKSFENFFARKALAAVEMPLSISQNLKLDIRKYQEEAFKRFIYLEEEGLGTEVKKPFHLLFNMATGSGKTLVMAGLMLYLYEKGFRNFLFFVNSNNIIQKTKDNFLNPNSAKYLFTPKIAIQGRDILLKEVNNFDEADTENINIKFTTIQQLHIDLNNTKENSITFEDFQQKKVCLIADEAHHLSSGTRSGDLFGSWEGTVLEILAQNLDNFLLEFTATLDYDSREIVNKYKDKVIYKYDLKEFRNDKFSKEISLIRSLYEEKDRIIQALILNTYRQELAIKHHINLKPVIFFKAQKTIAESERNKAKFHQLIADLNFLQLENVRNTSSIPIVQKAFQYFENQAISIEELTQKIKNNFKVENCLSANESDTTDKKKRAQGERSDQLLNTLEESSNPIRAIFAVQKLNEGWDVLNLFDIVRLYEGQNTGGTNSKISKTTVSEAQLIGRGARYYPFKLADSQDKYTRKFDNDISNELKVLEELYYHTRDDRAYISELKKALIETGIYENEDIFELKQLVLKPEFKNTDFYKTGRVFYNKKVVKDFKKVYSFDDLGVKNRNSRFNLSSGIGRKTDAFLEEETQLETVVSQKEKDIKVSALPVHILRYATSQNPFFYFENILTYFPNLSSISEFISSEKYLAGLSITYIGTAERVKNIHHKDLLESVQNLLQIIELELKNKISIYEGSDFKADFIHNVFKDKALKIHTADERMNGQESLVAHESWYVYNANYGTSEEKDFVALFARKFEDIQLKYEEIYLIRNERALKIFDKQGRAFEPDFLLFCKPKQGESITYQVFIEPKGLHLKANDKWKEDFLQELRQDKLILNIHSDKYLITGVPFYNSRNQNEFYESLENLISS